LENEALSIKRNHMNDNLKVAQIEILSKKNKHDGYCKDFYRLM